MKKNYLPQSCSTRCFITKVLSWLNLYQLTQQITRLLLKITKSVLINNNKEVQAQVDPNPS